MYHLLHLSVFGFSYFLLLVEVLEYCGLNLEFLSGLISIDDERGSALSLELYLLVGLDLELCLWCTWVHSCSFLSSSGGRAFCRLGDLFLGLGELSESCRFVLEGGEL